MEHLENLALLFPIYFTFNVSYIGKYTLGRIKHKGGNIKFKDENK